MDKQYIQLFKELAHANEIIAERVRDIHLQEKDEKGINTAEQMRNEFAELYDLIKDVNFDFNKLTKQNYAKLLVGAVIFAQQLENKIKSDQKVLQGYKIEIIPKLNRIINETTTDEECQILANKLFENIEK